MPSREIADKLISAKTKRERERILLKTARTDDLEIAHSLKNICYEVWTSEPIKTQKTALALQNLITINPHEEIKALAFWVAGIAELTKGKLEKAVENLDNSAAVFQKINQEHAAANTQVAKLIALAMLGKYDQAVETGNAALEIFVRYGDELAAGKIEKNLGNIVARSGKETAAEKFYLSARERFAKINNQSELAMSDNSLANTYTELNDFRQAEKFYAQSLESARHAQMRVTEAEIEASIGNLALFRGRFDEALRYLELSRQKYEELKMPHQTAIAELEIADIYLELNLADEAFSIYKKVSQSLKRLKLQGEEARARANFGKAALLKKDFTKAKNELKKAGQLYVSEKNPNGAANVKLTETSIELSRQNYENALKLILKAEKLFKKTENPRQKLLAKWFHGEILRNLRRFKNAAKLLTETYTEAIRNEQKNLAQICLNSLGNLALQINDTLTAENHFKNAVKMIETLRAPLPAEEFRMAFLADKLAPFESLAKIYLAENDFQKAFSMIEKARARTLSENLDSVFVGQNGKDSTRLVELREELNWFYSRLSRAETDEFESLQKEVKKREKQIAEVMRQIESTANSSANRRTVSDEDSFKLLQNALGTQKALIEFVNFEGIISAFVISDTTIEFIADLAKESEIIEYLEGLQFQFGALRFGRQNLDAFMPELKKRADFYLQKLYDKLIEPLSNLIGERDLVVVPVGALHYVPFHALHTGEKYLIETREIVYAPSATVWRYLNETPAGKIKNALLIGFADEKIPLVNDEIEALQKSFSNSKTFTNQDATFENYTTNSQDFDVLHLACHGQFRPDNPMFSSLHLANGFVTVRDICSQKLNAELVTLSACETGLNKIFAGDEILGLSRGFLSAGAKSLVLSLWTVSDEATIRLMKDFYTNLQRGESVAASLRQAQRNFIERGEHPYFWSPFALIGK
jgi:CHAT domain-containing protein